jgi:hypothetical protein
VPVDLLQKRALATELGEVALPAVPGGLDADEFDLKVLDAFEEQIANVFGLSHGHR